MPRLLMEKNLMAAKFIIQNVSVSYEHSNYLQMDGSIEPFSREFRMSQTKVISLELLTDSDIDSDMSCFINAGNLISICDPEYIEGFESFKKEFKEFLLEKYPEKIIREQTKFNKIFGG